MARFIIKVKEDDGSFKVEGYERMTEVTKRMKRLTAYNKYFQVIHEDE